MVVEVYSKKGCDRCEKAKEKLTRLGLEYREHDLGYHVQYHEGWREDGSIEVLAAHSEMDALPLFRVGDQFMDYAGAMKVLKRLRNTTGTRSGEREQVAAS
jgi:glutaredoxin